VQLEVSICHHLLFGLQAAWIDWPMKTSELFSFPFFFPSKQGRNGDDIQQAEIKETKLDVGLVPEYM
jgi:hypothetical protein